MPTVRLTAFFKDDDGHGWSETHDKDGGSSITSLTTFLQNFNQLMITKRRPLLAGDAYYIGCRASYRTADGTIAGDNIELDPPLRGVQTFGSNNLQMTAPEVAVKMRLRNDASTARSDVYLRGMWSQCVLAGVLDFGDPVGAEWKTRADQYAAALIAGNYGWVGTNPAATSRGVVSGYISNADLTVTFTVARTKGGAMPADGTQLPCRFARINSSKSILNRTFVCTVGAVGTTLTTTEKVTPSEYETPGTFTAIVTGFIPYAAQSYYKLARRATGRPFGVGRGRLPIRVLH